ncbi:ATP-binding protein [Streptomyces sp. KR55]|uniref:ATP-binding protein n=1 Tax=Streptomyces sp. KR55 TaxID=3457425 RepID=UPI003FD3EB00
MITALESHGDGTFEMRFTSTPRGARLARRLVAVRLDAWGLAYGTEPHDEIVLIVAELTVNAVRHGHVPGRDFHLRVHAQADGTEETGRGLLLVSRLAARWDWHPRSDGPGKTVWAECVLPGRTAPAAIGNETDAVSRALG